MQILKKEWQTNKQTRRKKDGRKIRHSKRKKERKSKEREEGRIEREKEKSSHKLLLASLLRACACPGIKL